MKALIYLIVLLSSIAVAETGINGQSTKNLYSTIICISPNFIRTADKLKDDSARTFSTAQYEILKTKLTAYRIPFTTVCERSPKRLNFFVVFDGAGPIGASQAKSWNVSVGLFAQELKEFPDGVYIYNDSASGVSLNYTDDEQKQYIAAEFAKIIDGFAANYALANPLK